MSIGPILFSSIRSAAIHTPKIVTSSLMATIGRIASEYFGLGQGVFFLGYGTKELFVDGIAGGQKIKPIDESAGTFAKVVHKIRSTFAVIFKLHGTLYLLSAIAWIGAELDTLKWINLGTLLPIVKSVSNILFLGACSLAIGCQIAILKDAHDLSKNGNDEEKKVAKYLKVSSILVIVGNIGYIAAVGAMMFGATAAIAGILGLIAVTIGCIRVYYDYKYLTPALERV